ncbi:MAG TPA: hypothetical protein VGQ08_15775 [Nitrospiraceae bacterium]|nr:hypothetical protein [Nitrospiraceae bacterium]
MAQPAAGGSAASGAVGGAASGASMGAMLGPWGAAVGAVGGGVMGILGGQASNKAAKAAEEARRVEQENVIRENRRRATEDYLNQTRLEREQQSQEEAAVATKGADIAKETQREVATSTASAAERGVAGRTIDDIAADYEFQADVETGRLKANQAMANRQHEEQLKGYSTDYVNRVTDVRPYVPKSVAPVDYFGPVFSTVGQLGKLGMDLDAVNKKAGKS